MMIEKICVKFSAGNEQDTALFCITVLALNDMIYLYRGKFVIIVKQQHQDPNRVNPNYAIKFLTKSHIRVVLNQQFQFIKNGEIKPHNGVPPAIIDAVTSGEYSFDVPLIRNLSTTPILMKNGELFTDGHDKNTNLYVVGFRGAYYETDHQGSALAQYAVKMIRDQFCNVTFASELDFSVFVAALMTALLYRQLGTKPAFAINAKGPRSGKSALVSAITALALGEPVTPMNHPKSESDFDRRLDQELRHHPGIISIDNISFPLNGARLCSVLSEPFVSVPARDGMSYAQVETALLFLNGNDLEIASPDLARRTLVMNLTERRDALQDDQLGTSWISYLTFMRGMFVVEMMCLLRAFAQEGRPSQTPALGSFEEWSRLVRDPIIWAGLPDPVQSQEQFTSRSTSQQRGVLQALLNLTGGKRFKASFLKDCIAEGKLSEGDLRAMLPVGPGALTTATIGRALHTLSAHPEDSLMIRRVGGHAGVNRWRVEPVSLN